MTVALDPAISAVARLALALLFASAAAHKLRDVEAFRGILADYRLAPEAAVPALATMVVAAEIAVALALVASLVVPAETSRAAFGHATDGAVGVAPVAALAAAALLVLYGAAMAINLARGRREIDCGCGGPGQPLHPALLARNAIGVGACALAALPVAARPLGALDAVTVVAGVAGLALAWTAAAVLLATALAPSRVAESSR